MRACSVKSKSTYNINFFNCKVSPIICTIVSARAPVKSNITNSKLNSCVLKLDRKLHSQKSESSRYQSPAPLRLFEGEVAVDTIEGEIAANETPENFWAQTNNREREIGATRSWLVGAKRWSSRSDKTSQI